MTAGGQPAVIFWRPVFLFLLCLGILLRTLVPTIYTLDSSEFVTGAKTLGFVHAPGYPLYLLLLRLFLTLPLGDAGWQGNVFSALCLALTVPVVDRILHRLTGSPGVAMSAALIFAWSYYVWLTGLFTEVYALQLLTLAVCGLLLTQSTQAGEVSLTLLIGAAYGIAVAVHPVSVLFAPGMVAALRHLPWRDSICAGLLAVLIFLVSLLYFPIRAAQNPALNMAGFYDWQGQFQAQDLRTLDGILWMLRGQQFESLMFENGVLPSFRQLADFAGWFVGNWLGFGFLLGLGGLVYFCKRGLLLIWFLPYLYFYLTYGAQDRDMMLGPLYLLWTVPLAFGLKALVDQFETPLRTALLAGLPALMLIVNFPLLDLSDDTSVRDRSEAILEALPPDSLVFGEWRTASPLVYYQTVRGQRPDVTLYNLFLFPKSDLRVYVAALTAQGKPVIFTEGEYARELLGDTYTYEPLPIPWAHPDFEPLDVVKLSQQE